jgi:hypothetical protein
VEPLAVAGVLVAPELPAVAERPAGQAALARGKTAEAKTSRRQERSKKKNFGGVDFP